MKKYTLASISISKFGNAPRFCYEKLTLNEHKLIAEIIERLQLILLVHDTERTMYEFDKLDMQMRLATLHVNGCRLNLLALLLSEQPIFVRELLQIKMHLDPITGKLPPQIKLRFAETVH